MKQRGFTLIELIIVIVILGILAVTAAPRFIDIQGDARSATLDGVLASLQSASQLVYAKSAIAGNQKNAATDPTTSETHVEINTVNVGTDFGYPSSAGAAAWAGSILDVTDFTVVAGSAATATATDPGAGNAAVHPADVTVDFSSGATSGRCYVRYTDAANQNSTPTYTKVDDDC